MSRIDSYPSVADTGVIAPTIADAKGDLIAATAADAVARVAVGTDGQVLTADAASTPGVKWATPSGGVGMLANGYAEVTASQTVITTEVDLTGLAATVTVASDQRIKITACVSVSGTSGNGFGVRINEGATVLQDATITIGNASNMQDTVMAQWVGLPSAGSHTYKLSMRRFTGAATGTMFAAADTPAFILVEAIA